MLLVKTENWFLINYFGLYHFQLPVYVEEAAELFDYYFFSLDICEIEHLDVQVDYICYIYRENQSLADACLCCFV